MAQRLGIIFVAVAASIGCLLDPLTGSAGSVAAAEPAPVVGMASPGTVAPAAEYGHVTAIERVLSAATQPARRKGTVATKLYYKRLGIRLPIREAPLSRKYKESIAYHHRNSAWPGSGRATYLFGHARAGTLLRLWRARKGDLIYLTLKTGKRIKYKVYARIRVSWYNQTWVYRRREVLALQTCVGRDPKGPRLIVLAKPVR